MMAERLGRHRRSHGRAGWRDGTHQLQDSGRGGLRHERAAGARGAGPRHLHIAVLLLCRRLLLLPPLRATRFKTESRFAQATGKTKTLTMDSAAAFMTFR